MPGISEKIKHPTAHHLFLYKEGAFWVAYEQSAFYVAQHKNYRATKKYVKAVGEYVVSIGFPKAETLLDELATRIDTCNKTQGLIEIVLHEPIDLAGFETWKASLAEKPQAKPDIEMLVKLFTAALRG